MEPKDLIQRPKTPSTYYSPSDDAPDALPAPPAEYSTERVLYEDNYLGSSAPSTPKMKQSKSSDPGLEASAINLGTSSPMRPSLAPDDKGTFTWNDKYQLLLDSLPTEFLSSETDFAPVASFCWDLLRLSKDFVHLASLYGKIIISEKALAEHGTPRNTPLFFFVSHFRFVPVPQIALSARDFVRPSPSTFSFL